MMPPSTSCGAIPSWEELINPLVPAGKLVDLIRDHFAAYRERHRFS